MARVQRYGQAATLGLRRCAAIERARLSGAFEHSQAARRVAHRSARRLLRRGTRRSEGTALRRSLVRATEGPMARGVVWNFGSPLAGTGHCAAALDGVAREYGLDEIILAIYGGNELQDNRRWTRIESALDRVSDEKGQGGLRVWLRANSRLAGFLWITVVRSLAGAEPSSVNSRAVVEELWPHTEQALEELLAAAAGRPVTIWYIPNVIEWGRRDLDRLQVTPWAPGRRPLRRA